MAGYLTAGSDLHQGRVLAGAAGLGDRAARVETATGRKAFSVGKPSPVMMRAARKQLDLATADVSMIGDTMETDILGGTQMGYHTILVLTGGTKLSDLDQYAYQPDTVVDSIADLIPAANEHCNGRPFIPEHMSESISVHAHR